jgi:hypothetical protein
MKNMFRKNSPVHHDLSQHQHDDVRRFAAADCVEKLPKTFEKCFKKIPKYARTFVSVMSRPRIDVTTISPIRMNDMF